MTYTIRNQRTEMRRLRKTFTACPDHRTKMAMAAFEAIKHTSTRHKEILL